MEKVKALPKDNPELVFSKNRQAALSDCRPAARLPTTGRHQRGRGQFALVLGRGFPDSSVRHPSRGNLPRSPAIDVPHHYGSVLLRVRAKCLADNLPQTVWSHGLQGRLEIAHRTLRSP